MSTRLILNTMGARQINDLRTITKDGGIWNCTTTFTQRQRLSRLQARGLVDKKDGRWILSVNGQAYVRAQGWV